MTEIPDIRENVKEEIDRMSDDQVRDVQKFIESIPDPVLAAFRNAPCADDPVSEEEQRSVLEVREWFKRNGGRGIPHDEVMRDLGLD